MDLCYDWVPWNSNPLTLIHLFLLDASLSDGSQYIYWWLATKEKHSGSNRNPIKQYFPPMDP